MASGPAAFLVFTLLNKVVTHSWDITISFRGSRDFLKRDMLSEKSEISYLEKKEFKVFGRSEFSTLTDYWNHKSGQNRFPWINDMALYCSFLSPRAMNLVKLLTCQPCLRGWQCCNLHISTFPVEMCLVFVTILCWGRHMQRASKNVSATDYGAVII